MGWVLLAWWFSRGLTVLERAIIAFFVVFTVFSTMGTGEHYLVDLIVAFPFAVLIEALCRFDLPWRSAPRLYSILLGFSMILAWFAALRFAPNIFLASPIIGWLACAVTMGACVFEERSLAGACSEITPAISQQRELTPSL